MSGLVVGGDHVGRVPPSHRSWRALHHHQPDGGLRGLWIRGVLFGGIFAPAVVHDTGYEEDQEQDNVAGDENAEVQSDRVDLLVVLQKAHGAVCMLGFPEGLGELSLWILFSLGPFSLHPPRSAPASRLLASFQCGAVNT